MVNYCIDKKTCKRNLIAKHFNDDVWANKGDCNKMCDFCKDLNDNKIERTDVYKEACLILNVLEKSKTEKKLTSNKLAEVINSEIVSKNKKSNFYQNNLNQHEVENLILTMLMNNYLKEDFHFTPYNTICYLIPGPLSLHLKNDSFFYIDRNNLPISSLSSIKEKKNCKNSKMNEINIDEESKELKTRKRNLDLDASSENSDLFFDQNDSVFPKKKKNSVIELIEVESD